MTEWGKAAMSPISHFLGGRGSTLVLAGETQGLMGSASLEGSRFPFWKGRKHVGRERQERLG